ncbi:hypothetical protein PAHA111176_06075 [Parendozoicomonas haliclonae]|uniref:Uncharacterized protein n=1 Tax=Parendozoicomonas haliclonae TaxID=1960125 RepID=A0A1X7AN11_9GAMM|nr:hypothetical protein EHSB41UT_02578 [Parendozoicomonas haliclonae]
MTDVSLNSYPGIQACFFQVILPFSPIPAFESSRAQP